ncbi:MAG: DUF4357 domain-containing protein [Prevotella sp.]|nr:DUF4357 domain-containing protein [Prevotella sp.]
MDKKPKIDINEEFEKLFPPTHRESVFGESEDYESFRQYIIDHPRVIYHKNNLPFCEVKIISYVDYKKQDVIDKEKNNGKHIFYLKHSRKGQTDFCDSAGFYVKESRGFVILPYSHIINEVQGYVPKGYERKGKMDGSNLYTLTPLLFHSPEDAASFVLGKRAGMDEWLDARKKGLLVYYKELVEPNLQLKLNLFDSDENDQVQQSQTSPQSKEKHIVYIREDGVCDAKGYYDKVTKKFILMAGSIWSLEVTKSYQYSASEIMRRYTIIKNCKHIIDAFKQFKDVICESPSQAASYVLGRSANGWEEWIDKDGRTLKEIFNSSSEEELKKKGIAEVVAMLQFPSTKVLSALKSGKDTIMGILYELSL